MSAFGLLLLLGVGAAMVLTGLPAFAILIAAALVGAIAAVLTGTVPIETFGILPGRLLALLDHDLMQALPLFVFMGVLLERMAIAPALFSVLATIFGRARNGPAAAGMILGALLGPMNGSVTASVLAIARSAGPPLAAAQMPPANRLAIVAVAGTLGVVVPPSLVLILLGDAMLTAHTIAVNATGRTERIINVQDVFRGAFVPAALVLLLCLLVAVMTTRKSSSQAANNAMTQAPGWQSYISAAVSCLSLAALLAAVALGYLYAVEAAATGAFVLFVFGIVSGRLRVATLNPMLTETLRSTGTLFAPLLAATTFTLVLRTLGTDKLVASWLAALPGSTVVAIAVVLAVIALSALVLDAFEIIFVVVPIVIPPLLMREPDAVWVATLVLLTLQASFLLPPVGYALLMARSALGIAAPARQISRALAPFLLAQLAVVALVLVQPRLVHSFDPKPATATAPLSADEIEKRMRSNAPLPPVFGTPPKFD